jgi:hypothetical protein
MGRLFAFLSGQAGGSPEVGDSPAGAARPESSANRKSRPQTTTAPNQTGLTRIVDQPDLARPNWTVENRRLAVIS